MERKKLLFKFLFYNGALLLLTVAYAVSYKLAAASGSDIFACRFLDSVGIYCIGCGGSRALIYLLNFQFLKSFIYYPPLIITLILIIIIDIFALLTIVSGENKYLKPVRAEVFISVPALMILNFLIRTVLLFCGVDYIGDVL